MKIFDGKTYRDATEEEIAEFERARKEAEEEEKNRDMTADEIATAIQEIL